MQTAAPSHADGGIAADALRILASIAKPVDFPAQSLLFEAGAHDSACYLIDEGRVRIEVDSPEIDSDNVHAHAEAGAILGELSLIDGMHRTASAYADTPVRARRVNAADVDELRRQRPDDYAILIGALASRASVKLRQSNERLADLLLSAHDPEVEELVARAAAAQATIEDWPEERIDAVLKIVAEAVAARAREFAEATVRVTRMGDVESKTAKNRMASLGVFRSLAGRPAYGALSADAQTKVTEFAAPIGIIFALVPVTNPVSTAVFKTLIAIKSRNAVILSYHSAAQDLAADVGGTIAAALQSAGAPADLSQWVKDKSSRRKTQLLMHHPKVGLILATGGTSMVKSAYSSGKPAIGVGPGNTPALVAADADVEHAARSIVTSKSFDNGLICGSEHNIVVNEARRAELIAALERAGAAVLGDDESRRFAAAIIDPATGAFRAQALGQDAALLARYAGISRDHPIKLIVVPSTVVSPSNPFAREKMMPVTSLFAVADDAAGIRLSLDLLAIEGPRPLRGDPYPGPRAGRALRPHAAGEPRPSQHAGGTSALRAHLGSRAVADAWLWYLRRDVDHRQCQLSQPAQHQTSRRVHRARRRTAAALSRDRLAPTSANPTNRKSPWLDGSKARWR